MTTFDINVYHVTKYYEREFNEHGVKDIQKNDNCIAIVYREQGTQKPNFGLWQVVQGRISIIPNQNEKGFESQIAIPTNNENISALTVSKTSNKGIKEILVIAADGTEKSPDEIIKKTQEIIERVRKDGGSPKMPDIVFCLLVNEDDPKQNKQTDPNDFLHDKALEPIDNVALLGNKKIYLYRGMSVEEVTEKFNRTNIQDGTHVLSNSITYGKIPKKKSYKKAFAIAGIIALIVAAAVGAYFGLKDK